MTIKTLLVCVSALLVQNISGQYLKNVGIAADGYGFGWADAGAHADAFANAHAGAITNAHAGAIANGLAGDIGLADHRLGWHDGHVLGLHAGHGLNWHTGHGLGWHADHDVVFDNRLGLDLGIPYGSEALPISSKSPISPSGIAVVSENAIEGALAVTGKLPFLSAVAVDGALPTAGSGAVAYDCADGRIYIDHSIGDHFGYGHDLGFVHDGLGIGGYGLDTVDLRLGAAGLGCDGARIGLVPRARAFY